MFYLKLIFKKYQLKCIVKEIKFIAKISKINEMKLKKKEKANNSIKNFLAFFSSSLLSSYDI